MIYDVCVVGGGAAGISSASHAYDEGLKIIIIEREAYLGGILNQCIHHGFGLHHFKEELTGPEYALLSKKALDEHIEIAYKTSVMTIKKVDDLFILELSSKDKGIYQIQSKAVIIATGSYERTRSQIELPGKRIKGVLTAGSAQRYINQLGYMVGKRVVILGSGDIGLIMARRLTLEGAKVLAVVELMKYSNGLTRNIVSCLDDFDIPLYLSHTVTDVLGNHQLEGVVVSKVDESLNVIEGSSFKIECDTLLLSVGLIPEISLLNHLNLEKDSKTRSVMVNQNYETSVDGLFICGNSLQIHDLVDFVSIEASFAGKQAKKYVFGNLHDKRKEEPVYVGEGIRYVVPQKIDFYHMRDSFDLSFRTKDKNEQVKIKIYQDEVIIKEKTIKYAQPSEMEKISIERETLKNSNPISMTLEVIK